MGTRSKLLVLVVVLAVVGGGVSLWLWQDRPSYESRFSEYLWIEFPPGHPSADRAEETGAIDRLLRKRRIGHVSGVTSRGDPPEIAELELAVDLEAIEAESLLKELTDEGLLPAGTTFEAGSYPRSWPDP